MDIKNLTSDTTKFAAANAPEARMSFSDLGISGVSSKHLAHAQSFNEDQRDWFNKGIDKLTGFAPVAGPAIYTGIGTALLFGDGVTGGLTSLGVALTGMATSSKKRGPRE